MGLMIIGGADCAPSVFSGSFTSASTSASATQGMQMFGPFNLTLQGTGSATIVLQRSFDGQQTWNNVSTDALGQIPAAYTASCSVTCNEVEPGVYYRLVPQVMSTTSSVINWRVSGGPRNA